MAMRKMLPGESESQAVTRTEKEILVKFKSTARSAQIKAMESELGLKQIKEIAALNVRVYQITSAKTVKESCKKNLRIKPGMLILE